MARWGDEKTLLFVMQYREYQCLWNTSSPLYKNKIARDNAYKSLLEHMNDENLTVKIIKNKIKNLRTTYHQELKKIKDSMRSGASSSNLYKPTIPWFKEMHSFLGDTTENRETISTTVTNETTTESDGELLSGQNNSESNIQAPEEHIQGPASQTSREPTQHQENIPELNKLNLISQPSSSKSLTKPVHTPKKQTLRPVVYKTPRSGKRHHDDSHTEISNALQKLENISTLINGGASQPVQDEFHYFGMNVAAQLRQLPLHVALQLQDGFQKQLTLCRIRHAQVRDSRSASQTSSSSTYNDFDMRSHQSDFGFSNVQQEAQQFSDASPHSLLNVQQAPDFSDDISQNSLLNSREMSHANQHSFLSIQQEATELSNTCQLSYDTGVDPLSTIIKTAWDTAQK